MQCAILEVRLASYRLYGIILSLHDVKNLQTWLPFVANFVAFWILEVVGIAMMSNDNYAMFPANYNCQTIQCNTGGPFG